MTDKTSKKKKRRHPKVLRHYGNTPLLVLKRAIYIDFDNAEPAFSVNVFRKCLCNEWESEENRQLSNLTKKIVFITIHSMILRFHVFIYFAITSKILISFYSRYFTELRWNIKISWVFVNRIEWRKRKVQQIVNSNQFSLFHESLTVRHSTY